jgi:glycerate dehydrogenase
MFNKLLFLGFERKDLTREAWDRIHKISRKQILGKLDSIAKHYQDADGLLLKLGMGADKALIDNMPKLKYIGMFGTGYGRIDTLYARKKGVTVCNIAGYSREGVAELVFGMLLGHIRDLERAKSQARKGDYSEATFKGFEIKDKNFGVIGLGRNGSRVAEIAHNGFHAKVSYWSRNRKKALEGKGIKYQSLASLLKQSDFISINVAYVPETKNLLNKKAFSLIRPGCIVVSTVQNEVCDFEALVKRLKRNDITFILDHPDELTPKQAKELSKYKNCVMYPPIGYVTREATEAKLGMFVDNLENFLKGKPTNKVN